VPDAIIALILNDYRGAIKVCKVAAVNKVGTILLVVLILFLLGAFPRLGI
jgi:hypothetical protein